MTQDPDPPASLQALLTKTGWPLERVKRVASAPENGGHVPGLPAKKHWEVAELPALSVILANQAVIGDELIRCFDRGLFIQPDEEPEHGSIGGWTLFHFFMKRAEYEDNLADCPTIHQCLTQMRKQVPMAAMWSASMQAGTEIPPHHSPDNTVIRAHVTLRGTDDTALMVEDEIMPFAPEKPVIFQPCFQHQAWNRDANGRERLILSMDFWHPELTRYEIAALQFMERTAWDPGFDTQR